MATAVSTAVEPFDSKCLIGDKSNEKKLKGKKDSASALKEASKDDLTLTRTGSRTGSKHGAGGGRLSSSGLKPSEKGNGLIFPTDRKPSITKERVASLGLHSDLYDDDSRVSSLSSVASEINNNNTNNNSNNNNNTVTVYNPSNLIARLAGYVMEEEGVKSKKDDDNSSFTGTYAFQVEASLMNTIQDIYGPGNVGAESGHNLLGTTSNPNSNRSLDLGVSSASNSPSFLPPLALVASVEVSQSEVKPEDPVNKDAQSSVLTRINARRNSNNVRVWSQKNIIVEEESVDVKEESTDDTTFSSFVKGIENNAISNAEKDNKKEKIDLPKTGSESSVTAVSFATPRRLSMAEKAMNFFSFKLNSIAPS